VPVYAAPARAIDLSGLPPAFIDVRSTETFRDEAITYAAGSGSSAGSRSRTSGRACGFQMAAPHAAVSQDARATQPSWLRGCSGA
jgi:acetyl esterase/lipase